MDTVETRTEEHPSAGTVYDGFISYSHAADGLLAPRLQSGLQRFAKPWWKRRALRIFRDESSLSANPHLWSSITTALDQSDWFVLLLSPEAAQSEWVNQEVEYWSANKDPDRIIPVLTEGDFGWSNSDVAGDAVPPALKGAFSDEPRWVDVRFARTEEQLDLQNPAFSAAVADIASAIRGVPKDELASEEVRQHRRTVRTAWAAGLVVLMLALLAGGAAIYANDQRSEARSQQAIAESLAESEAAQREVAVEAQAAAEAEQARAELERQIATSEALAANARTQMRRDPELALLLALAALEEAELPTATDVLHEAVLNQRTANSIEFGPELDLGLIAVSPDGQSFAYRPAADSVVELRDVATRNLVWSAPVEHPVDRSRAVPVFTQDGTELLVLAQSNDSEDHGAVLLLDTEDGSVVESYELGDCAAQINAGHGSYVDPGGLVVVQWGTRLGGAESDCNQFRRIAVGYLDLTTGEVTHLVETDLAEDSSGNPTMSADGSRFAVGYAGPIQVYDTATRALLHEFENTLGDSVSTLNAAGTEILIGVQPIERRSVESGELLMIYQPSWIASRALFSGDEAMVVATDWDGTVRLFDTAAGDLMQELRGHQAFLFGLSLTEDPRLIATQGLDGVRLWDVRPLLTETTSIALNLPPGAIAVPSGHAEAAGEYVVAPYMVWPEVHYQVYTSDGQLIRESPALGHYGVSPDGSFVLEETWTTEVITPSGDLGILAGSLRLVDTPTGEQVRVFEESCGYYITQGEQIEALANCADYVQPTDVQFSADGSRVALLGSSGNAAVYDVATGVQLWVSRPDPDLPFFSRFINQAALSPDGSIFVAALDLGALAVVDIATGETVTTLEIQSSVTDARFHPTEPVLFVALGGSDILVIDTATWEVARTLERAQGGAIRAVALSPDGRVLAASSDDQVLRLWDWQEGTIIGEIEVVDARQILFLDTDHILLIDFDGRSTTITLDAEELDAIGRARVTRTFTDEECATYGIEPCPTLEEIRNG